MTDLKQMEIDPNDDSSVDLSQGEVDDEVRAREMAEEGEVREVLASQENRAVAWLRVLVFFVLVVTAVLVSVGTYMYTRNDEEEDFEHDFSANAAKVIEAFHDAVDQKLGAADTLSATITTIAIATGSTFPNVTIPDFEFLGSNARIGADSALCFWLPLVTDETRKGWEAYAAENQHQLIQSFVKEQGLRAEEDEQYGMTPEQRRLQEEDPFHDRIYGIQGIDEESPEGSGPFLPFWQSTPALPIPSLLNFDVMSHPAVTASFRKVLESGDAVLDVASNMENVEGDEAGESSAIFDLALSLSQYRYTDSEFKKDPTSTMTYPVFDSFEQTKKVAGVLTVNLYWSLYFKDVLSTKAKGIEVVLENTLNQSFTYRIDGPEATYLGPGDRHDPSYDYLMVSADVAKYVNTLASPATRSYTTVNLNDEYLAYKLRVYPSSKTEDDYLTNEPVIFTVVVAAVFLFTSMIFVFYDVVVARRQRIVMERALASGAIVNSLFPEQVRKQLYQENEQKTEPNSKAESFMRVEESSPRQNASLFENTTILFADLAGFTKWSSGKTPAQVFDLLEAFYGAFDAIALKRGVFKVETIGDCYVAVTGLPEPQKNHAIIMVRFARDCMAKLNELKHELVDKLGAETAELEMRVGLHSGPVTAGVLRGSKGRFQLFGDTMNTASRMESNGVRGRIHVSQATADEVTAKGKGQWVTAREDKITAKGKGEMQTYFIHAHDAKSSNKTSVFSDFD